MSSILTLKAESLPKSPHQGFTLLEVMAAISIMAIVLTAVFQLHIQTISMNNTARFYTTAPLLAQTRIAVLEISDDISEGTQSGDFGNDFPGYTWTVTIEQVEDESEILGSTAQDLKKIDVSVDYNEGEFSYDFRTYRMLPEE